MSDVTNWDPVDSNNNDTPPDGFPEGMSASAVNDASRAVMGGVRRWADEGGWFDHGHTYAYVSATTFQAQNGDFTSVYLLDRPVRADGSTTGRVSGYVTSSTFASPHTEVTVAWRGGGALQNEALVISVGIVPNASGRRYELGEIKDFAYTVNMASFPGWLRCGQAVSRTTYSRLFSVLGTTWGAGDGSTTFDLPPNGRVIVSADGSTYNVGDTFGVDNVTLTANQSGLREHTHSGNYRNPNKVVGDPGGTQGSDNEQTVNTGGVVGGAQDAIDSHENRQPSMVFDRLIYAGQ